VRLETANVLIDAEFARSHDGMRPGEYVEVRVVDTGIGMDEAVLSRLFEPFFTTKPKGKGTGLGLSTTYGIVKQSGGYIRAESAPGKGTCFRIYLPRVHAVPGPAEETRRVETVRGSENVLVVEDEPEVRSLVERVLKSHGYRVLVADRPSRALEIATKPEIRVDLMVTDVVMPGMNGCELARRIEKYRPDLPVLYLSGYTDEAIARQGILNPGIVLLEKPFRPTDLAERVREALDSQAIRKAS
jgi:CheY-like chemotaxis protein